MNTEPENGALSMFTVNAEPQSSVDMQSGKAFSFSYRTFALFVI